MPTGTLEPPLPIRANPFRFSITGPWIEVASPSHLLIPTRTQKHAELYFRPVPLSGSRHPSVSYCLFFKFSYFRVGQTDARKSNNCLTRCEVSKLKLSLANVDDH